MHYLNTKTLSRFITAEGGTSFSNDAPEYYGGNNNGDDSVTDD